MCNKIIILLAQLNIFVINKLVYRFTRRAQNVIIREKTDGGN